VVAIIARTLIRYGAEYWKVKILKRHLIEQQLSFARVYGSLEVAEGGNVSQIPENMACEFSKAHDFLYLHNQRNNCRCNGKWYFWLSHGLG
jgi:hypothetical protein